MTGLRIVVAETADVAKALYVGSDDGKAKAAFAEAAQNSSYDTVRYFFNPLHTKVRYPSREVQPAPAPAASKPEPKKKVK